MSVTTESGLVVRWLGRGKIELSRDGSTREETWSNADDLAARLLSLGIRPEALTVELA